MCVVAVLANVPVVCEYCCSGARILACRVLRVRDSKASAKRLLWRRHQTNGESLLGDRHQTTKKGTKLIVTGSRHVGFACFQTLFLVSWLLGWPVGLAGFACLWAFGFLASRQLASWLLGFCRLLSCISFVKQPPPHSFLTTCSFKRCNLASITG